MERTATYGSGVSSLVNCFLRINSLIQSSQLCAGIELKVSGFFHLSFYFFFIFYFLQFIWICYMGNNAWHIFYIYPIYRPTVFNSCVGPMRVGDERKSHKEYLYQQSYGLGTWLGSHEGLFYMHWPWTYCEAITSVLSAGGETMFLKTASPQTCKVLYCLLYGWHSNDNAEIGPLCSKYHQPLPYIGAKRPLWR